MKKQFVNILFFFLISSPACSQNWISSYYYTTTLQNFRTNKLFTETIDFNQIDYPRLNAAIFYVTNEERVKNNLPAVTFHKLLEDAASDHSKRMVRLNYFNHIDPYNDLLKTPSDRLRLAGVANPYSAENIAAPFAIKYEEGLIIYPLDPKNTHFSYSPNGAAIPNHTYLSLAEYVVQLWMNSKGHRANILNPNAKQLGCGTFFYREKNNIPKFMATQNFQLYEQVMDGDQK